MDYTGAGVRMRYLDQGTGETVLLLHGWGGKAESFLPLIRDLSPHKRVIAVDFPGHGASDEPSAPWSVSDYADYIHGFLQSLGINHMDIVAHSFGCRVAIRLASSHPALVGRMVLTGAAGLPPRRSGKKTLKSRAYRVFRAVANSGLCRALAGEKGQNALRERLIQRFGSADYKALTPSMRQTFNKVISEDLTPCLSMIKAPTLLVWGQDDTETPLWMGQTMEKLIPDAGLVSWPGCGHFAYLDRYGDFRRVVENFLRIDQSEAVQ